MRKPASDSITGLRESAENADYDYVVPPGLEKLTEYEQTIWDCFIPAKTVWKDADLVLLHQLCKMYGDLRDMRADEETRRADVISWQKMMAGQVRVLGLNSPHNVAVRNASDGKPSSNRGRRMPSETPIAQLLK